MDEQRLSHPVHSGHLNQRRMQREHAVQLRSRCIVADQPSAQAGKGRIAGRSEDIEAIGRPALDDEDEPALGRHSGESKARCHEHGTGAERDGREELAARDHRITS